MSDRRYTAQELRERADYCGYVAKEVEDIQKIGLEAGEAVPECFHRTICNMLRQAADAEEENVKLKSRLEAVVKECEKLKWDPDNWLSSTSEATCIHNWYIDRVLRAAREEGGAE